MRALLLLLALLAGCSSTAPVRDGTRAIRGRAIPCWLSVGHVAKGPKPIMVGGCHVDVVPITDGKDPIVLLIPRRRHDWSPIRGDSGTPVWDPEGKLLGLLTAKRGWDGDPIVTVTPWRDPSSE